MCRYCINPYRQHNPDWNEDISSAFESGDILDLHRSLPEYAPTPIVLLPNLASRLGVGKISVKDESHRFGLKAFKALGASYAIYRLLKRDLETRGVTVPSASEFYGTPGTVAPGEYTFCTATDGNHGRGVAWTARKLNQRAMIYMPANAVSARIENIRSEGAEVIVVDGTYDDAVRQSASDAEANGWTVISDTSWPGYIEIPRWIMAGYLTMFREIHETGISVDVVFVQAGVGALAAAAAWYYNREYGSKYLKLISVEPTDADCLLESIMSPDGRPTPSLGAQNSVMAGLNCGTPSEIAWPFIRSGFDMFMTVPDQYSYKAMRAYFHPEGNDPRIVSGESGAAGLAALMAPCDKESLREAHESIGISPDSSVLLLNTEGDTDPANLAKVTDH